MSALPILAPASNDNRLSRLEQRLQRLEHETKPRPSGVAIICMSGDFERTFAAFTVATGALAMGQEVDLYFTFWGASAVIGRDGARSKSGSLAQRMMRWLQPRGVAAVPLSRMSFWGLGKLMLGRLMRRHGIADLASLMQQAKDLGARFHYCETSMRLFGWDPSVIDLKEARWCGVASFLSTAEQRHMTLVF